MGKHVAKGKVANKLQSKANKKLMKPANLKALQSGAKKQIGAKAKNQVPQAKANAQNKSHQKAQQAKNARKLQSMAKTEEEFHMPDQDMMDDQDSNNEEDLGFLDNIAENNKISKLQKQRKRQIENAGEDFEVNKRSFGDAKVEIKKRSLLPVIDINTGRSRQVYQALKAKELNDEDSESSGDEETTNVENTEMTLEQVKIWQKEQQPVWDNRFVQAANRAMANPEEHGHAALRCFTTALHFDGNKKFLPLLVRQRSMLSGGRVLEDILPAYRIRKLTEAELKEKVKKEVKILREYEQGLLELYQKFLKRVEFFVLLYKSPGAVGGKKKRGKNQDEEANATELISKDARLVLARTAIKTLSNLMVATTHFNFSENLVETVVNCLSDLDEEIGQTVMDAVTELFKTDKKGELVLLIVRKIAALVRTKEKKVHPRCIDVLLRLRITQVEDRQGKDDRDKERKKVDRKTVSKQQNRQRKKEAKLMKELKETEAVENQSDRLWFNAETIQAVFGIYFRILKSHRIGELISPTLNGIGKYGHFINIDLVGPLLGLLADLLSDQRVPPHNRLKAAKTSAVILSGQGEELLVDPKQLYFHIYQIMEKLNIEKKSEVKGETVGGDPWPALFDVLWALLIDRKKHLNGGRVNAYLHRIMTTCVRLSKNKGESSTPFIVSLLLIVRSMVIHHRCTKSCLDDEAEMASLPVDKLDPDLVMPNRVSCVKELEALTVHPNYLVVLLAKHIQAGAPSNVNLPKNCTRKRPSEVYKELRFGFGYKK